MENLITDLHIKNFKSIKELDLKCKRINVLIGKPNSGKSNILEALSLFCLPFDRFNQVKVLQDFIRYENLKNLFYDNEISRVVEVKTNINTAVLKSFINNAYGLFCSSDESLHEEFKIAKDITQYRSGLNSKPIETINKINFTGASDIGYKFDPIAQYESVVKKYIFKNTEFNLGNHYRYLTPPNGDNLPFVMETNRSLRDETGSFFEEYGLEFLIRSGENKFEIQKKVGNISYTYPYSLTADTLQRMIFYLAAIKSNNESILLFEEPETHTFPSYTAALAYEIVESKDNQFFITTHNPYLLDTILEESDYEETAVFKVSYNDYQTNAEELTEEEIDTILNYGADVFINEKSFGK